MSPAVGRVFIVYPFNYCAPVKRKYNVAVVLALGMHVPRKRPHAHELRVLAFGPFYLLGVEEQIVLVGVCFVAVGGDYLVPAAVKLLCAGNYVAVPALVVSLRIKGGRAYIKGAG